MESCPILGFRAGFLVLPLLLLGLVSGVQFTVAASFVPSVAGVTSPVAVVDVGDLPFLTGSESSAASEKSMLATADETLESLSSPEGSSSLAVLTGFEGLGQNLGGMGVPPDVQIAAGPDHLVEMVNFRVGFYSKQGMLMMSANLSAFFASEGHFVFDPKVLFDAQSGRWFASATDKDMRSVRVAVSSSGNATGTWTIHNLSAGNSFPDQPIIGTSDDKFTVSADDFNPNNNHFRGVHYWVVNKSQMVAGASADFVSFGPDPNLRSVHPVRSLSSISTQYMVHNRINGTRLFTVEGVPPAVTISLVSLPIIQAFSPPDAEQPQTSLLIETDDWRVRDAAWFRGRLWLTLTTHCTPPGDTVVRSCVRLTQINTNSTVVAQDFNFGINATYLYYPALSMDNAGNLLVIYGYSSKIEGIYPSLAVTGQAVNDLPNTLQEPVTLRLGSANDTSGRYGDYFGAGTDPVDPTVVWVAGEYHDISTGPCFGRDGTPRGSCWSTFVGGIRLQNFTVTANPSALTIPQGATRTSILTISSSGGFSGTVGLTAAVSPAGPTLAMNVSQITLADGGSAFVQLAVSAGASGLGNYRVTVTGTSGPLVSSAVVNATVVSSGGGGGGSVAYGTLITLADGREVPVQSVRVGDELLGYDTATGSFIVSIVTSVFAVDTENMLVIHTESGTPFRVDANPAQTLWVKTVDGSVGWVSVTLIRAGDSLFTEEGWVTVTGMDFAPSGRHVMFDIIATAPYFASGYLDPPRKE